jgi:hypothetical protein
MCKWYADINTCTNVLILIIDIDYYTSTNGTRILILSGKMMTTHACMRI